MRERTKWILVLAGTLIACFVLTAACDGDPRERAKPTTEADGEWSINLQWIGVVRRFDDKERGVTCYVTGHGISCVRMQP